MRVRILSSGVVGSRIYGFSLRVIGLESRI